MIYSGLRSKILAGLALISFIFLSILVFTIHSYLSAALEKQLVKRGEFIASAIAEQSLNHLLTRNHLAIDLMLHEYWKGDNDLHYIYIHDPAGQVISHTFRGGFPLELKEMNGKGTGGYNRNHINLGGIRIIDIAVPLMQEKLGHLHVGMSHSGINKEIRDVISIVSLVITVHFLLAALFMWLFLERIVVRPVKSLNRQVQLLGTGDFNSVTSVTSSDELGALAHSLDEMRSSLSSLYSQMAEQNSEQIILNEKLEELATTDGLTGLFNHRHFYSRLADEVKRARRYHNPLSLIMADIDHFKRYNDTLGHVAGDKVLQIIAGLIAEHARENDLVARYGGEEIVIILPETDLATAHLVAERMRFIIESSPELAALAIQPGQPITMSFGVSQLDEATETPKGFVRLADAKLYRAKQNGRNRVEC